MSHASEPVTANPAAGSLSTGWRAVLTGDLAAAAVSAARDVASRLIEPAHVESAAAMCRTQTAFPRSTHWVPYTVSQGYAGLALLWAYLDRCFPDEQWDRVGRDHLTLAARGAEVGGSIPVGLFSGTSGLAFAAAQLSRDGVRYQRLLATLDDAVCPQAIAHAEGLVSEVDGITVGDFDVISGLSGIGAYLLHRCELTGVDGASPARALSRVTSALVEIALGDGNVPRWHTPARLVWDEGQAAVYPHGNLNCGLAHGIPGPLALLSLVLLSQSQRTEIPQLTEAIDRLVRWLCDNRCDDSWGLNWPTAVPLERDDSALRAGDARQAPDGPSRCAWCYGSPGIARALWLAGEALDRDDYRATAVAAMEAIFRRPIATRRIDSPTFCHGVAGLLQIALRFAHDTGLPRFADESRTLACQLLDSYRPESLLAFRNLETAGHEIDQPGLLDGSPGVALTLLAAATNVEPTWDRLFLLS